MIAPTFIMASASKSRAQVLAAAGISARIVPSQVDETKIKEACRQAGHSAADCAMRLAEAKAQAVSLRNPAALVLGADQMLVLKDRWFDKPVDQNAARDHLKALRGQRHELMTALAVMRGGVVVWRVLDKPALTMRDFSDEFLEDYLARAGDAVTQSVGAYQLENLGVQLMAKIEGDHSSILGLPLFPLLDFLRGQGLALT